MKKLIAVPALTVLFVSVFGQGEDPSNALSFPESITVPFYEKALVVPYRASRNDIEKIVGSVPVYNGNDGIAFEKELVCLGKKYFGRVGFAFSGCQLVGAHVSVKGSANKEEYERSFNFLYGMLTEKFGGFDQMYWYSYAENRAMPENGFEAIMGKAGAVFKYFWDEGGLSYAFEGGRTENDTCAYVYMDIFIRNYVPREAQGYVHNDSINVVNYVTD